jgi:hypothetical protein
MIESKFVLAARIEEQLTLYIKTLGMARLTSKYPPVVLAKTLRCLRKLKNKEPSDDGASKPAKIAAQEINFSEELFIG